MEEKSLERGENSVHNEEKEDNLVHDHKSEDEGEDKPIMWTKRVNYPFLKEWTRKDGYLVQKNSLKFRRLQ